MKSTISELGVALIYFSGFEKVLESNLGLIQAIEIEPQTFWYRQKDGLGSFAFDTGAVSYLQSFNQPKIFHGVGFPVGGLFAPLAEHIPCLQNMAAQLNPVWISEHLSFNTIDLKGQPCNTNFLLPPLQTPHTASYIANTIKQYAANFSIPFAFETGTNYLQPKAFDISDGQFICSVAQQSGAHIVLDLHNLLANQLNGRQNVWELLHQIPLESVIEIHLAGGFYFNNYYLDAHSGPMSNEVLELFEKTVAILPNLKAVTFEMLPDYLSFVEDKEIQKQLENMNRVWDKRGKKIKSTAPDYTIVAPKSSYTPTMQEWEHTLGLLAINRKPENQSPLHNDLINDPGLDIIKTLIKQFKASGIVGALKLSCRYIILHRGIEELDNLLESFWLIASSNLFASENGITFANYLLQQPEIFADDMLADLVLYEKTSLLTMNDSVEREIEISFNPYEIIPFLEERQMPININRGQYVLTIVPNEALAAERLYTVQHS